MTLAVGRRLLHPLLMGDGGRMRKLALGKLHPHSVEISVEP
jgi:hypothetical protein